MRDDFAIGDHLRILPTPGHTPGHVAFAAGRGKDDAVFCGDIMHSPLQTRYPELSPKFDVDPALAAKTRRDFMERYCDTDTLCCTRIFRRPRQEKSAVGATDFPGGQPVFHRKGGRVGGHWSPEWRG